MSLSALVAESLVIDERFNGPPDSANGGYTCGLLAELVGEPAEVTLRAPPPLGRELAVAETDEGASLRDGETVVAEARTLDFSVEAPAPPALTEAGEAEQRFPFAVRHPFPSCFVCGPTRGPSDGLRIFAGPTGRDDLFAATWTPAAEYAKDGAVEPHLVWAALDCPTAVPVTNDVSQPDYKPIVLARLAVKRLAEVEPEAPHVITAWPIERDGRKRHAGAAIFTAEGELRAYARALWIELR